VEQRKYSTADHYQKRAFSQAPVAQEADIRRNEVGSQPQGNSLRDPILKRPFTKTGWWSGSSSNASNAKRKGGSPPGVRTIGYPCEVKLHTYPMLFQNLISKDNTRKH
jgi:hypothetical protein